MFKKLVVVGGALVCALSLSTSALAADIKIGLVDIQELTANSAEGKRMSKEMQDMMEDSQKKMEKDAAELKTMVDDFQKNKAVMSKEKVKDATAKISAKQVQLQQLRGQMQQQYMAKNQELMTQFTASVKSSTKKVADKQSLDLVLPNNVVIYAKSTKDITNDVSKLLK